MPARCVREEMDGKSHMNVTDEFIFWHLNLARMWDQIEEILRTGQ